MRAVSLIPVLGLLAPLVTLFSVRTVTRINAKRHLLSSTLLAEGERDKEGEYIFSNSSRPSPQDCHGLGLVMGVSLNPYLLWGRRS